MSSMSLQGAESSPSLTVKPQAPAKLVFPVCEAGGRSLLVGSCWVKASQRVGS